MRSYEVGADYGQSTPEAKYPIKTWEDVHQETWRRVNGTKQALIDEGVVPDSELTFEDSSGGLIKVSAWATPVSYSSADEKIYLGDNGFIYLVNKPGDAESDTPHTASHCFVPDEFLADEGVHHHSGIRLATYFLLSKVWLKVRGGGNTGV